MKGITNLFALPRVVLVAITLVVSLGLFLIVHAATPLDIAGYLNFSYGLEPGDKVTGEKPESKLWWHSGSWWGSLYNSAAGEYRIYRLNAVSHDWEDTGVVLDDRPHSRADVLWDGAANKLYVASQFLQQNPGPTSQSVDWGRLYRYSFDTAGQTYLLDDGFPVTVNEDRTESLVLDKDSHGRLWVTYVSRLAGAGEYQVYVNASQGDDQSWGTPFPLPFPAATVDLDDISALIAFTDENGPQIGVMWSNQIDDNFYFATHPDDAAPEVGWHVETITAVGYPVDDHINLAATAGGQILAAVKLETTEPDDPLIGVIGRDSDGSYSFHPITFVSSLETRPIIVIDDSSNEAYVFATNKGTGGRICYWPSTITTSLADLSFPQLPCAASGGDGAPILIGDSTYNRINYATSTKQNTNSTSGIVVLASEHTNNQVYVHNLLLQLTPTSTPTTIPSVTPSATNTATPPATITPGPTATPDNGLSTQVFMPIMRK